MVFELQGSSINLPAKVQFNMKKSLLSLGLILAALAVQAQSMFIQDINGRPIFENGYTAPDPCEWEEFILKNKHLPGIPSAKQVEANGGIELGETQRLLLEKIEQLTLMVIEQQKQIDALKK